MEGSQHGRRLIQVNVTVGRVVSGHRLRLRHRACQWNLHDLGCLNRGNRLVLSRVGRDVGVQRRSRPESIDICLDGIGIDVRTLDVNEGVVGSRPGLENVDSDVAADDRGERGHVGVGVIRERHVRLGHDGIACDGHARIYDGCCFPNHCVKVIDDCVGRRRQVEGRDVAAVRLYRFPVNDGRSRCDGVDMDGVGSHGPKANGRIVSSREQLVRRDRRVRLVANGRRACGIVVARARDAHIAERRDNRRTCRHVVALPRRYSAGDLVDADHGRRVQTQRTRQGDLHGLCGLPNIRVSNNQDVRVVRGEGMR